MTSELTSDNSNPRPSRDELAKPRITTIIPLYNGQRFLAKTVESVLSQTYGNCSILIVDDGSTDLSGEIADELARQYANVHVIHQKNAGVSAARNHGANNIDEFTEYVHFLDGDDILYPKALDELYLALEKNPSALAAHGLVNAIDENDQTIKDARVESTYIRYRRDRDGMKPLSDTEPTAFDILIEGNCIPTPGTVLLRRATLDLVGGFEVQCGHGEDWDYWLRIAEHSPIAFVPKYLLGYRQHATSVSKNLHNMELGSYLMRLRLLQRYKNSKERKRIASQSFANKEWLLFRSKCGYAAQELKDRNIVASVKQILRGLRHLQRCLSFYFQQ